MRSRETTTNKLVLIAGASCSGKTTLLRNLVAHGPAGLPSVLADEAQGPFVIRTTMDITRRADELHSPATLFLHYDIFRPLTFHGKLDFSIDPVLSIIDRAADVKIVTLCEAPELLQARAAVRQANLWKKLVRTSSLWQFSKNRAEYRGAARRRDVMAPWFTCPSNMWTLYDAWFSFCDDQGITDHWIVQPSQGPEAKHIGTQKSKKRLWL